MIIRACLAIVGGFLLFSFVETSSANQLQKIRVLTYESLLGKYGLAPIIEEQFKKNTSGQYSVEFVKTNELSGLLGKLRQDKRSGIPVGYQMVMGLDETSYRQALKEGLIDEGRAFDESPFSIVYDSLKLQDRDLPKSWSELGQKFSFTLLVQDPRTSTPGLGWLRSIYEFSLLKKAEASKIVRRVFPSWSSSYSAFQQGESNAVWSFQTSEAYHRCNQPLPTGPRYKVLPLKEGYPKLVEYVAAVKLPKISGSSVSADQIKLFQSTVVDDLIVQEKIYTTQWMFPVNKKAKAPDCFSGLTQVKILNSSETNKGDFSKWIDDWSR